MATDPTPLLDRLEAAAKAERNEVLLALVEVARAAQEYITVTSAACDE